MKAKKWKEFKEFLFRGGKTVHERAKLLAASGKQNRLDMSAAHVLELLERYPSLYREAWTTPSNKACRFASDGFCIGDGWFGIVDRLSAKLSADPNLHVCQIKEKYGSLRVYFCDVDAPPDPTSRQGDGRRARQGGPRVHADVRSLRQARHPRQAATLDICTLQALPQV